MIRGVSTTFVRHAPWICLATLVLGLACFAVGARRLVDGQQAAEQIDEVVVTPATAEL